MNYARWAASAVKRRPQLQDYAGCSYEEASRRAQAICVAAGESGQTINASVYLTEYTMIMNCLRSKAA